MEVPWIINDIFPLIFKGIKRHKINVKLFGATKKKSSLLLSSSRKPKDTLPNLMLGWSSTHQNTAILKIFWNSVGNSLPPTEAMGIR